MVDFHNKRAAIALGCALELLARSSYHKRHNITQYFHNQFRQPYQLNQAVFFTGKTDEESTPTAFVTWARLSVEVEKEIHATGRELSLDEWDCGDRLFINDWITPYNNFREIANAMTRDIFPNEIATSIKRNYEGDFLGVKHLTGINLLTAKV